MRHTELGSSYSEVNPENNEIKEEDIPFLDEDAYDLIPDNENLTPEELQKINTELGKVDNDISQLSQLVRMRPGEIQQAEILHLEEIGTKLRLVLSRLYNIVYDSRLKEGGFRDSVIDILAQRIAFLVQTKKEGHELVGLIFSNMFNEFSEFIDDFLVSQIIYLRAQSGESYDLERVTQGVYGRSRQEVEDIKEQNRFRVVSTINELSAKGQGIDISDIESLHKANNKGIVPSETSFLRGSSHAHPSIKDMAAIFKKRVGTHPDDVNIEMTFLVEQVNELTARLEAGEVSGMVYAMEAARLHNNMLSIHPFGDRNGSTCLLLLEYLMAKRGYEPPEERIKDYYKNLSNIFGKNPLPMSIIYVHHKGLAKKHGYYIGVTGKKREKFYNAVLEHLYGKGHQVEGSSSISA